MSNGSIGEIPIPGLDPYSEIVELAEDDKIDGSLKCPQCGSPHGTLYSQIMTMENNKDLVSGDLSFRKIVIVKCLNCGHSGPVKFIMVRNM